MAEAPRPARDRELDWADGTAQIMAIAGHFAQRAGCTSIECGWEVLDRVCLIREPRPRSDDRVEWFFRATRTIKLPRRRPIDTEVYGGHVVEPGSDHARGCALAAVEFLRKVGLEVHVTDLGLES